MKSLKIFYLGEHLRDVYPHATKWEVLKFKVRKAFKAALRLSMAGGLLYAAFIAGAYLNPMVTYATQEKIVTVDSESPVMDRIAKCESNGSHYAPSGQVVYNANSNGTVDVGIFQINSIWNKKATEMGLDLTKEEDNKAFGLYLYKNFGTEPWKYSAHCWNK